MRKIKKTLVVLLAFALPLGTVKQVEAANWELVKGLATSVAVMLPLFGIAVGTGIGTQLSYNKVGSLRKQEETLQRYLKLLQKNDDELNQVEQEEKAALIEEIKTFANTIDYNETEINLLLNKIRDNKKIFAIATRALMGVSGVLGVCSLSCLLFIFICSSTTSG